MNIAIDVSPLKSGHFLQHRVRGTGFYLENLRSSLEKYYPNNEYIYFTRGEKVSLGVDLVHYPYFEPFFLTLPFNNENKFVVTVHDLTPLVFPNNFPAGLRGKIKWKIQKARLRKAKRIITDSMSSKKDIVKYVGIPEDKVTVVYLAAGEEFRRLETGNLPAGEAGWKSEIKKRYGLPERFVLYVGDVTWNKNLPSLIRAVKIAGVPLVMVGKAISQAEFDKTNPWNQDLLKVQELIKDDGDIFVLGFVEQGELVALYNMATVFAMPSLYEGFGLPILEAMGCGCPVVTSKMGSIPEIAGEAAYYVDAYNISDIALGLERVFNDAKLQKKLSEKGTAQSKKFSWKKTAEDTVGVYEEAVLRQGSI
ncbi:MAG: glycosyltransferase family 1 protein [Candidatus Levyibacteriota bacterium]